MRKSLSAGREIFSRENSLFLGLLCKFILLVRNKARKNAVVVALSEFQEKMRRSLSYINIDCAVKAERVLPAVCGAFLGAFSGFFVPYLMLVIGFALYFLIGFAYPKKAAFLVFFSIPVLGVFSHPSFALIVLLFPILLGGAVESFARAYGVAGNSFSFFFGVFSLLLILSGVLSVGGRKSLVDAGFYFVLLIACPIITSRLTAKDIEDFSDSVVLGALVSSFWGIWQIFNGGLESGWLDVSVFSDISVRISSGFDNPNLYAAYLLLAFPFALENAFFATSPKRRVFCLVSLPLLLVCLVQTWSRGAWLGLLVEIALFVAFRLRRAKIYVIAFLLLIALAVCFAAPRVALRFASIGAGDSSVSYRISAWRGISEMMRANKAVGIGFGEAAFRSAYPMFSYSGATAVKHSHSLYLQILVEMGAIGLLSFAFLMLLFLKKCFALVRKKQGTVIAGLMAVLGSLVMGVADYIWYSSRVFFLFWAVVLFTCRITDKEIIDEVLP